VRSLERVAVHEAGHAVAAEQVGFGQTRVELLPDGAGTCYFDADASSAATLLRLRRQLVVMLSGLFAEYMSADSDLCSFPARTALALECSPRATPWATLQDFDATVARLHPGDRDEAQLAAYRWLDRELPAAAEEGAEILKRNWERVLTLADRLLDSRGGIVNLGNDTATFSNRSRRRPVRLPLLTTNKTCGAKAAQRGDLRARRTTRRTETMTSIIEERRVKLARLRRALMAPRTRCSSTVLDG
jgi:hypothetical protein